MMKKQVTIVAVLLILVALSSNLDMVAEAQFPLDCYDGCTMSCLQHPDLRKLTRCHLKCSILCGPDAQRARETGV